MQLVRKPLLPILRKITDLRKAGGVAPPAFSPAELFSSGQVGGWYDPSDLSTLFQDTAGTVPVTASGQSVGLIRDKSGNGLHLALNSGTITYNTTGKPKLVFNGSGYFSRNIALAGTQAAFAIAIGLGAKPAASSRWLCSGNNAAFGVMDCYTTSAAGSYGGLYTDGTAGTGDLFMSDAGVNFAVPHAMAARTLAGKSSLDGAITTQSAGNPNWAGVTRLTLGAVQLDSGPFGLATGDFYGGIFRTTEWTDAEDAKIATWFATKF